MLSPRPDGVYETPRRLPFQTGLSRRLSFPGTPTWQEAPTKVAIVGGAGPLGPGRPHQNRAASVRPSAWSHEVGVGPLLRALLDLGPFLRGDDVASRRCVAQLVRLRCTGSRTRGPYTRHANMR